MIKKILFVLLGLAALAAISLIAFSVRRTIANREIEAEWLEPQNIIPVLAETSRVEIIPLYEEEGAGGELITGHGVSYLIRTDSATVLFDIGNNPDQLAEIPFRKNLQTLGIDWTEVDRIVLSHSHPDHLGGIKTWWNALVSMKGIQLPGNPEEVFIFSPAPLRVKGAVHVTIPTLPVPQVATTGVISFPEIFPLSLINPKGGEQSLVVHVTGQGLVLITGCGHPGLEKLVERAETLYGYPVIGVVGGLHNETQTAQEIETHIQYLQNRQPGLVALSPHDSSPQARAAFETAFGDRYHTLRVGEAIQFP